MPDALPAAHPGPLTNTIDTLVSEAASLPSRPADTNLKRVGLVGSPDQTKSMASVMADAGLSVLVADTTSGTTPLAGGIAPMSQCELVLCLVSELDPDWPDLLAAINQHAGVGACLSAPAFTGSAQATFAHTANSSSWLACQVSGDWYGRRLLQLRRSPVTDPGCVDRFLALGAQLGWPVVLTPDHPLDPGWRIEASMLFEAMAMLGEAVDPEHIEQTAREIGLPVPPLERLDDISLKRIDHLLHAELHELAGHHDHHDHGHDHDHHGHDHDHDHGHGHGEHGHHHHPAGIKSKVMPESAVYVMEKMAHGFGRLGRQAGAGFYDYDYDDDPPELWEGLSAFARGADKANPADCADRLLLAATAETMRCLDEGLFESVRQADLVAVMTGAFPVNTGGPLARLMQSGLPDVAERCAALAHRYGSRFALPGRAEQLLTATSPGG